MRFHWAAATWTVILLGASSISAEERQELQLRRLQSGQQFEIHTADRVYRGEMIDPTTGESLVRASWDGVNFSPAHKVFVLGSTQGDQPQAGGLMLILMQRVKVGMRVELGIGSLDQKDRRLTAPVRQIELLPAGYSVAREG